MPLYPRCPRRRRRHRRDFVLKRPFRRQRAVGVEPPVQVI